MISSGNQVHDANALVSDMLHQGAINPPNLQNNSGVGALAFPPPPVTAAAARQADILYFRRLIASALATGVSPSTYLNALQSLGASLFP
jgi:hypothetical protein